jgi:hypothetical protein
MSRCDEPQAVFVHGRCTWCILSTEDRPWLTTKSTDIVAAAIVHVSKPELRYSDFTLQLHVFTGKGYTRVLRLPNQGVKKKREARAFTKPRSSES